MPTKLDVQDLIFVFYVKKNSLGGCQCLQLDSYWRQTSVELLHLGELVDLLLQMVIYDDHVITGSKNAVIGRWSV